MSVEDITDNSPNKDLIRHLEKLLKYAKTGELRSYISICGWNDDAWSKGWVMDRRNSRLRMLGMFSKLYFDLQTGQALDDVDSELVKILDF